MQPGCLLFDLGARMGMVCCARSSKKIGTLNDNTGCSIARVPAYNTGTWEGPVTHVFYLEIVEAKYLDYRTFLCYFIVHGVYNAVYRAGHVYRRSAQKWNTGIPTASYLLCINIHMMARKLHATNCRADILVNK